MILLDHWLIPINPFSFLGHLGVVIFFVLSGFLITRILFQNADDCRKAQTGISVKVIRFIYRRSLRIFPGLGIKKQASRYLKKICSVEIGRETN